MKGCNQMNIEEIDAEVTQTTDSNYFHGFYGLLSNEGHNFTKEQIIQIAKELDFHAQRSLNNDDYNNMIHEVVQSLRDEETFSE